MQYEASTMNNVNFAALNAGRLQSLPSDQLQRITRAARTLGDAFSASKTADETSVALQSVAAIFEGELKRRGVRHG